MAAKTKIEELQKKIKKFGMKCVEAENLQIVKTVNINNKTLIVLLKAYATGEFKLFEKYEEELENMEKMDNENLKFNVFYFVIDKSV